MAVCALKVSEKFTAERIFQKKKVAESEDIATEIPPFPVLSQLCGIEPIELLSVASKELPCLPCYVSRLQHCIRGAD